MHTIVTRRETQTQSCGSNLRMRLERDDTETRGLRGLGMGDVRGVVEVVLGEHLPKPHDEEKAPSARAANLKSRRTPCTSPGPTVIGYVHGVGAAAGNSDHVEEERNILGILRKKYCTRRGRALEAFRKRAKSRGRPVTSDRPPPRRCGQATTARIAS